ncbi:hypothetical protein ABZ249_29910 [Nocardiopsis sp. NPDC006139]|uniref:hypothetical protein n=1 Tax=Nocardiopsis sp. NPDC006139 TaxID=3154578 RepID=UPI0033A448B1
MPQTDQYLYRSTAVLPDGTRKWCDVIAPGPKEAREKIQTIYPGCTVRGLRRDGFVAAVIPTR